MPMIQLTTTGALTPRDATACDLVTLAESQRGSDA